MEKPFQRTTYWYKCLVCQRCFEQPKRLIAHRTQSECRFKYRIIHKKRSGRSTNSIINLKTLPHVIISAHENKILQQRSNRAAAPSVVSTNENRIPKLDTLPTGDPNSTTAEPQTLSSLKLPVHPETITSTRTEDVILKSTGEDQKQKQSKYSCYFCHSVFASLQHLQTHMPNHTKEKFSHKLYAEYTGTSSSLKRNDTAYSAYKKFKAFRCKICKNSFSRASGLKGHISLIHEGIRSFKCKTCLKCFALANQLKSHISVVHEGIRAFKCKSCSKCFARGRGLKRHIFTVHEGIKAFQCKTCLKWFGEAGSLKTHISVVHEGIRSFKCKTCLKGFVRAQQLESHISVVHEGIRAFKCTSCSKCFSQVNGLKIHISTVHAKSNC